MIVSDKLVLITTPDEMKEKVDWLKRVIDSTNMRVERFNQTQEIMKERARREELRKHEDTIRDALRMRLALG